MRITLRVNRLVSAAAVKGGPPPAPNVMAISRNADGRFSGLVVHPDAGAGRTEVHIKGRIDRAGRQARSVR